MVEAGTASGTEPTQVVELHSYLGRFLNETGVTLGRGGRDSHLRCGCCISGARLSRKLFAIHSKIETVQGERIAARQLRPPLLRSVPTVAGRQRCKICLVGAEYEEIKADYERVSLASFPGSYRAPQEMRFAKSDAMYPKDALRGMIAAEYQRQCEVLCFGPFPVLGGWWKPALTNSSPCCNGVKDSANFCVAEPDQGANLTALLPGNSKLEGVFPAMKHEARGVKPGGTVWNLESDRRGCAMIMRMPPVRPRPCAVWNAALSEAVMPRTARTGGGGPDRFWYRARWSTRPNLTVSLPKSDCP